MSEEPFKKEDDEVDGRGALAEQARDVEVKRLGLAVRKETAEGDAPLEDHRGHHL